MCCFFPSFTQACSHSEPPSPGLEQNRTQRQPACIVSIPKCACFLPKTIQHIITAPLALASPLNNSRSPPAKWPRARKVQSATPGSRLMPKRAISIAKTSLYHPPLQSASLSLSLSRTHTHSVMLEFPVYSSPHHCLKFFRIKPACMHCLLHSPFSLSPPTQPFCIFPTVGLEVTKKREEAVINTSLFPI